MLDWIWYVLYIRYSLRWCANSLCKFCKPLGLLQQSPGLPAPHPYPASPVSPKCHSKAHLQPETLRPHHWRAHQSPLVLRAAANYIQGGDAEVWWTWWCRAVQCTALHHQVHHTWRRHSQVSPTCRTNAGSGPPPPNGLTFQPAVGQQSEVVLFLLLVQRCGAACQAMWHQLRDAGGVQEQAQDVLVPPLLWNCSSLNDTILFPVISSHPVQWSLR